VAQFRKIASGKNSEIDLSLAKTSRPRLGNDGAPRQRSGGTVGVTAD
jgi:hypothetical protein